MQRSIKPELRLDDVAVDRQTNELGSVLQLQLLHDISVMHANSFGADGKKVGN